ncbi:sigma-54 interaction domain-containing protein [Flavobacterium sp. P21]|uniref:sigma-54 interaction domain-containing protein n=1 Tax=Flavobacterium sp. P21 TaxID=3423948 RepID=UPI003D668EF4
MRSNLDIKTRLEQREYEQSLIILMSGSLAPITTKNELNDVINITLKQIIGFSQVMICLEDALQKNYNLFYHNIPSHYNQYKNEYFTDNSELFASAFNSPEPFVLSKSKFANKNRVPFLIKETFKNSQNIVFCSIPFHYCKGVLIFDFKGLPPERSILDRIKMISPQLGITITNILLFEKNMLANAPIETHIKTFNNEETIDNMGIIGSSEATQNLRKLIKLVSGTNSNVLIQGESGTGKELVAKAIHQNSKRAKKPFIKINCAAIPDSLIESELFGYEKGSFSGAISQKIGRFEQAHQGTLFLDNINEMALDLQVKLLRAIQEKEIQRIGGNTTIIVDTRIITSCNKNLLEEVSAGNFRADLFYRLNVFPIEIAPLRDRKDDLADLANFFVHNYCVKNEKPLKTIADSLLNSLKFFNWPGNVRELEHTIERAVLLTPGSVIKKLDSNNYKTVLSTNDNTIIKPWNEFEKEYILKVLKLCGGKISGPNGAASLLKIPSTTLNSKIKKLGISKKHYVSDH